MWRAVMSEKPTYLGILNAIVNGERRGHEFLNAWSEKSPNAEVAGLLPAGKGQNVQFQHLSRGGQYFLLGRRHLRSGALPAELLA